MSSQLPAIRSAVRPFLEKMEAGDRIVVAVSGGTDSLALAYALSMEAKKLAIQLSAVTIDHQLQSKSGEQANQVVEIGRASCRERVCQYV
jgi:tRNA(Ile)-lysidine synthase